jgi:hypothetical protein
MRVIQLNFYLGEADNNKDIMFAIIQRQNNHPMKINYSLNNNSSFETL